jgi:mannitol-1-phosphate 5-dehydrogenase
MIAVHFGAGNIGRGFIGSLLYQSGYDVCFVDVNTEIVNLLNEKKEYRVVLASENSEESIVKNVCAINSITDPEKVIDQIAKADIVTTAVGPNILPLISDLIAKGLRKRSEQTTDQLNVIACENMIGGSTFLKEKVYEKLTESERQSFEELYAFPDSAVDRIVPNQVNEDKLMVAVEPFYEWVVDQTKMVGCIPAIEGITYVNDLTPYIERKLFTVNTGHAITAYLGFYYGIETIKEAIDNEKVLSIVRGALIESGSLLIKKYGFDYEKHMQYVEKIIHRFTNPYISDEVVRVARSPIRKLGRHDRLISPAVQYLDLFNETPIHLVKGIAAALLFTYEHDDEAIQVQAVINQEGISQAIQQFCDLPNNHELVPSILEQMSQFSYENESII